MPTLFEKHFLGGASSKTDKFQAPAKNKIENRAKEIRRIKFDLVIDILEKLDKRRQIGTNKFNSFMISQINQGKGSFNQIPIEDFEEILEFLKKPLYLPDFTRELSFSKKFQYLLNSTPIGNKYRVFLLEGLTQYIKAIEVQNKPAIEVKNHGDFAKAFRSQHLDK